MSAGANHLAALRELKATRTAKRNSALIGPIVEALEYVLGAGDAAPSAPAADQDESDTESVSVPEPATETAPLLVGGFTVEEAPAPAPSRGAMLKELEKETRKRLNKNSSRAEVRRRSSRILKDEPKGAGRGTTDSETVQALRSDGPKTFHVNLYV